MSAEPGGRSRFYPYYVVGVLMLAYMFSFIDRTILSLVIDPVRRDLGLTEVQISLLLGLAFATFYTLLGLPLGRIADTRSRRNLIAGGIALWSAATVACGFATSFWKMFAARMAVGVGEASLSPGAYSLIPDYVPPHRVGLAMSVFACGVSIGGGLAMVGGGYIVELASEGHLSLPFVDLKAWQIAFIAVGLPGLLVALLVRMTVAEPPRRTTAGEGEVPSVRQVGRYVAQHLGLFSRVFVGFAGIVVASYAWLVWGPTYFMRVHGLTPSQVGLVYGVVFGILGTVGVLGGGLLSDWFVRRGRSEAPVLVYLLCALVSGPLLVVAFLTESTAIALLLFAIGAMVSCGVGGMQGAMLQALVPNRMRGQVAALYITVVNAFGLGFAPTWTAYMTEHVFGGSGGIGPSLATTIGVSTMMTIVLLAISLRAVRRRATELAGNGGQTTAEPAVLAG